MTCGQKCNNQYSAEFLDSQLMHSCSLEVFAENLNFRGSGIVCTVGPACGNVSSIVQMIKAGMCIARHNFSHGDHQTHGKMMEMVRTARAEVSTVRPIAIALDTKGPEIRTGLNKDNTSITLVKDEKIIITTEDSYKESSTKDKLYIDYKSLAKSIKPGKIILVADGSVVLRATAIVGNDVECTIVSGATFGSRKNVCLPMVKTDLPALSEKDVSDIKFGIEQKVDIIFASFIRSADNVREIRKILNASDYGKNIKIVSKIENYEGVMNIREIIEASDGIMVARGDLGMDLDLERVNVAQKMIIASCNLMGKPVICATQMLESMIGSVRPTRAEVADVTNAILDGADCVMLSGESANGKYPIQAVQFMNNICHCAEKMNETKRLHEDVKSSFSEMTVEQAIAMSAVTMSYSLKADGIFVLTTTGRTAQLLSWFHPRCLIFAITRNEPAARSCHLYRNIHPLVYKEARADNWDRDVENRLLFGISQALDSKACQVGSKVIFVTGWQSGSGKSNSIRVATIGEGATIKFIK